MNTDDSMTSAEFRALVAERKASTTHKRSKYGARRTADGYASRREQARARQLRLLQRAGRYPTCKSRCRSSSSHRNAMP